MNALIDTHILLWWLDDPVLVGKKARRIIEDGSSNIYVSIASVWEIVLKKSLGKLDIPDDLSDVIEANRFIVLPIELDHVLFLGKLPHIHRDPFDRIIIAQAQKEHLAIMTMDEQIKKYPVEIIEG
jgi:PIN domain nuclease of toxin-antitoxin system